MKRCNESGITIVENLVAMALISIAVVGASTFFITTFQANAATRIGTSLVSDMQALVESYRSSSYSALLDKFNTGYTTITDGQTASESVTVPRSRATYQITFTAIKTNTNFMPEAVRVRVSATQNRGKLGTKNLNMETLIAQLS